MSISNSNQSKDTKLSTVTQIWILDNNTINNKTCDPPINIFQSPLIFQN